MSGGMPELGSKISLISKADIRYEGRLYTVDPQECTIALSSVRSFGTEDRETQFQIAPQSQIYDYILFRGSDIKDIRVVNNSLPHPNDPAIMQVQLPNGQHIMPHFSMPNINPHPPAPSIGGGSYGNPFGTMGGLGGLASAGTSSLAPGANTGGSSVTSSAFMLNNQQQHQQQPQQQHQKHQQQQKQATQVDTNSISNQLTQTLSVDNGGVGVVGVADSMVGLVGSAGSAVSNNILSQTNLTNAARPENSKDKDLLAGASRSTTPISLISRKSPADMGIQVNHQQQHQQQQQQHNQNNQHQSHQNNVGHGGGGGGGGVNTRDAGHKRQNNNQMVQHRSGASNNQRNMNANNDYYHPRDRRDSSGRNMETYNNHQQHQHDNRGSGGTGNNNYSNQRNNQPSQNRAWTMHRGQINMGGGGGGGGGGGIMTRNRGGGGRGRMPNQGYRPIGGAGGNQNKQRNPKSTIKFEQDYDFEQANNQFEELRSQLTKLKVGDEPKTNEQINGEAADKKDDSGNETGAGEHEHEEEEITVGYDKTKSFFDNISCEAAQDRSKNKRNDWRQERKLNSETFGVSSTRRGGRHFFANSYRGRGNYYSRNIGSYNGGGGGYNRGYRGGNNYNRNRNNNHRSIVGGGGNNTNQSNPTASSVNNNSVDNAIANSNESSTLKGPQNMSANTATSVNTTASTSTAAAASNKTSTVTPKENNTHSMVSAIGVGQ